MTEKRFKFRLQPVLDMRDADERRAKEQLAETLSARRQGQQMLDSANALVQQAEDAERTAAQAPTTAAALHAQQAWRERLERYRLAAGQQLEQAEREVTLSRSALVEAHQRRAVIDRLKDIQHGAHVDRQLRADAAVTDEIALQQHHGRMREA